MFVKTGWILLVSYGYNINRAYVVPERHGKIMGKVEFKVGTGDWYNFFGSGQSNK